MYESIIDALRRGDHPQALATALTAVADTPDDAQAHRWLAAAQRASGLAEDALASIDRAIALAPDDAELQFQRAGLLLDAGALDDAQAALARSVGLDPNQFGAYVMQAQLALGRGDTAEAERLRRLAARIAPEHPWVSVIEGMVALRGGDTEQALAILAKASEIAPDDAQVRHALGFAYMAGGHHAFAEQAFRGIVDKAPGPHALHGLIAELVRRQGRFGEAADTLAPLLAEPRTATAALRRFAGELQLAAGRHDLALPLLTSALDERPGDRRTLNALIEAWRRSGDIDQARHTLDAVLLDTPNAPDLWRARLAFEPVDDGGAAMVVQRWLEAMPDHLPALEAKMAVLGATGDSDAATAVAERIIELQPGHGAAELHLIDAKVKRDPQAAVAHVQDLLTRASQDNQPLLRGWLALAQDRAGLHADAARSWIALNAEFAPQRLPLPELTLADSPLPPLAPVDSAAPLTPVAFMVGAPGSRVEQLAALLSGTVNGFRADRFLNAPPTDALQNYRMPSRLVSGDANAAEAFDGWRDALPARGVEDGQILDWLLWWDNAFLHMLRPHLPGGLLLIALRDPRDMLLDWLAFGAPAPLRIETPQAAARWLAAQLEHVATLHSQRLYPHALLRLDEDEDALALSGRLAEALQVRLPPPPPAILGPAHFGPGHWRHYAEALAEPFALLTPVALRLGYPEN